MTNRSGPCACIIWLARSSPVPTLNPDGSGRSAGEGAIGSHSNRSLASLKKRQTEIPCQHYSVRLYFLDSAEFLFPCQLVLMEWQERERGGGRERGEGKGRGKGGKGKGGMNKRKRGNGGNGESICSLHYVSCLHLYNVISSLNCSYNKLLQSDTVFRAPICHDTGTRLH